MKFAKATKFHRKSGGGTAETGEAGFSRPSGTRRLSLNTTQDCVLGYFQVAPTGLELQSLVLTHAQNASVTFGYPCSPQPRYGFRGMVPIIKSLGLPAHA